ncbi:MAG: hypothetical protein HY814_14310 [Candidatus Riflebacteria bacterium]|nr:hypothetical protein [Candidatus Riflebacteria bacterium]
MTITARYPGSCARCGREIRPGAQIEWTRGGSSRHATCPGRPQSTDTRPSPPVALVPGGAQAPAGRTRRPASCERCGSWLGAGEGALVHCLEDSGCRRHHDESGWHVYCLPTDAAGCAGRQAARRAEATRAAQIVADVEAILPLQWADRHPAAMDRTSDDAALQAWRAAKAAATLTVTVSPSSCGTDQGSLAVVGEDAVVYHGGYSDDYRATVRRIPGGAEGYLTALQAVVPETGWAGQPVSIGRHHITVTRA